jgi:hypothetical protein
MISIEEFGDYIKYECPVSNNIIIYQLEKIKKDIYNVKFSDLEINWTMPKLVINILKFSIDDLQTKYHIENFIQTITKEEFESIDAEKKEKYIVTNEYKIDDIIYVEISCDIESALINIVNNLFRENPL